MRKLSKKTLDELAEVMPTISGEDQEKLVGGVWLFTVNTNGDPIYIAQSGSDPGLRQVEYSAYNYYCNDADRMTMADIASMGAVSTVSNFFNTAIVSGTMMQYQSGSNYISGTIFTERAQKFVSSFLDKMVDTDGKLAFAELGESNSANINNMMYYIRVEGTNSIGYKLECDLGSNDTMGYLGNQFISDVVCGSGNMMDILAAEKHQYIHSRNDSIMYYFSKSEEGPELYRESSQKFTKLTSGELGVFQQKLAFEYDGYEYYQTEVSTAYQDEISALVSENNAAYAALQSTYGSANIDAIYESLKYSYLTRLHYTDATNPFD